MASVRRCVDTLRLAGCVRSVVPRAALQCAASWLVLGYDSRDAEAGVLAW